MSGGGDLQANVTGRDNGASSAIDQSTKAMERLEKQTRKTNKEAKDLQKEISKNYKESGAAVAKSGGAVGSIGGRLLGGAGMDGNIGRAAVGFGLLSAAVMAYGKVMEAVTDKTQKAIDAARNLDAAKDKGENAIKAQARHGADQEGSFRELVGIGGQTAVNKLMALEKSGVDSPQAMQGIIAVLRRFPGKDLNGDSPAARALSGAQRLSHAGMPFGDAIQELLGSASLGTESGATNSVARIFKKFSGQRGDQGAILDRADFNVESNQSLIDYEKRRKVIGEIPDIERKRSGKLDGNGELAAAKDPITAALVENNLLMSKQLDALDKLAKGQENFLTRLWEATTGRIGTSAGQEAARIRNGVATAQFLPEQGD